VSPVKYELGSYIPEDDILHSHRHENLKSYILIHSLQPAIHVPIYQCTNNFNYESMYDCMHMCTYRHAFPSQMLHTVCCLYKYAHKNL
jgi:hypothetical protein